MNIYSCWLPSIYDAKEKDISEQRRVHRPVLVCGWIGRGSLYCKQRRWIYISYMLSAAEGMNRVHLMLQNEWTNKLDISPNTNINILNFEEYAMPLERHKEHDEKQENGLVKLWMLENLFSSRDHRMDDFTFRLTASEMDKGTNTDGVICIKMKKKTGLFIANGYYLGRY